MSRLSSSYRDGALDHDPLDAWATYQSRYGTRTESTTWMTPFDAWMSVVTIFAYQLM